MCVPRGGDERACMFVCAFVYMSLLHVCVCACVYVKWKQGRAKAGLRADLPRTFPHPGNAARWPTSPPLALKMGGGEGMRRALPSHMNREIPTRGTGGEGGGGKSARLRAVALGHSPRMDVAQA